VSLRHFDPVTLRLFVAVCEERNIARAAAREALVASAVSKRIAAVEQAVGAPLLVRGRRGIEPTAAGETLLRQARDVLAQIERLQAELSAFATGAQGSVRVAASVSALAEQLPEDIAAFAARHPAVRVSLEERVSAEILRSVREGSVDVGVLWDVADLRGLRVLPYRRDHLCVAMHAEHPLARRRKLRFVDTLAYDAVGVAPGGTMETMLRRQAALRGRTLVYRLQVAGLDAACRIVAAGLGVAIVPHEAVSPVAQATGLVLRPLAEPWAERRLAIVSRAEGVLPATTRLLVDALAAAAR
jgi:DNA-binding transcriptional LysR family regulator